jgi:phosphatidylethanolamine/phosphatidyl-N-methylethanolamine N-methyltransferase
MISRIKSLPRDKQAMLFLKQYLRQPRDVGSVIPSGAQLTDLMIRALAAPKEGRIVELGPGTGALTKALIASGIAASRLFLVERNAEFANYLHGTFPDCAIWTGDAQDFPALLAARGEGKVQRIVSGLPLRSMDDGIRRDIAMAVGAALSPGGRLVQFTYLSGPPIARAHATEAGLLGARFGVALGNVPPAFVWQYVKMA